jgi:hypothetical protein
MDRTPQYSGHHAQDAQGREEIRGIAHMKPVSFGPRAEVAGTAVGGIRRERRSLPPM